jgi:hypothetical protein
MNALCQARVVVWVLGTGDDTPVRLPLSMKSLKIGMVMGEHSTLVRGRIHENFRIVNALATPSRLLNCSHVVAQTA